MLLNSCVLHFYSTFLRVPAPILEFHSFISDLAIRCEVIPLEPLLRLPLFLVSSTSHSTFIYSLAVDQQYINPDSRVNHNLVIVEDSNQSSNVYSTFHYFINRYILTGDLDIVIRFYFFN